MSRKGKQRTAQLVRMMVDTGRDVLPAKLGISQEQAEECMRGAAYALCREMGGSEIYFPNGFAMHVQRRSDALRADADAQPRDLAQQHGLSVRSVQRSQHRLGKAPNPRAGSFVERLTAIGTSALLSSLEGADASAIEAGMDEVVYRLCRELGGCELYFPLDIEWHLTQRDRRIWADYRVERGVSNVLELSYKYGLTVRSIQSIIAWAKQDSVRANQLDFFEQAEAA